MTLIVVVVLAALAGVILIGMCSSFVELRARSRFAWSDIVAQLNRRHDLIPSLVESVKGCAAHEKDTFEDIARLRARAMHADTPQASAQAENQLSGALKNLFAVAENYPQLRASEQFTSLRGALNSIEDNIQNAGSHYNALIRDLNTRAQSFPMNIMAVIFGFKTRQFFDQQSAVNTQHSANETFS